MMNKIITLPDLIVLSQSCIGGINFGYSQGIIVGALSPIADKFNASTPMQGLIVCSILIGALVGSFLGGFAAIKFGRKPLLIFTALTAIGGAIGSGLGNNLATICILRFIHGLGVGTSSNVCPLMVAEMVDPKRKGVYGSFFQISITVGILIANILAYVLHDNWRMMFCLGSIPGGLLIIVWFIIPESPIFIQNKLKSTTTNTPTTLTAGTEENGQQIETTTNSSQSDKGKFSIIFAKQSRKPMLLGILLAVFQQLMGINAFMQYSTQIFKDAGISNPEVASIILQVWNVLTTLIAIFFVDRLGRKVLLLSGSVVMTICDLLIALFFLVLSGSAKGWSSIIFLFLFVGAFEGSIGCLFWFVINELLPEETKPIGTPVINAMLWSFNVILSFFFLVVVQYLGQYVMFFIFGGIGVACTVLIFFYIPNDLGKQIGTLEEIDLSNNSTLTDEQPIDDQLTKQEQQKEFEQNQLPPPNIQA